jgi:3-isopropylmalate dehydrogenase
MASTSLYMVSRPGLNTGALILTDLGSAPDIAGQGIVNPVATILSMSMMFKYSLCLPEFAQKIDEATKKVIDNNVRTKDIGGSSKTSEVGDAVAAELEKLLKK